MAEPVEPIAEPVEEVEAKPVGLDPSKSLSSQTKEIEALMPKEEDAKPDEKKPEEVPAPTEEEVEEPGAEEEAAPDEDSQEEIQAEPVELPPWQKYILDNLPTIQTIGHTGTGKDKVFTVKRVEDLPDGFEFASTKDQLAFSAALSSQEVNARELLGQYQQQEQQQKYQEFQNQEALDIQADISRLQKEGVINKFEHKEDDPKFNDDPAVKEANAIYDLYKKTNDSYLKTGRTYRITYEDAAYKYLGMKSRQAPTRAEPSKERQEVASKVSGEGAAPEGEKRGMPVGSSMQDVLRLYKLGRI